MPEWRDAIRARLDRTGLLPADEPDIVDELAHHLGQRYAGLLARGIAPDDAAQETLRELEAQVPLGVALRDLPPARKPPPSTGGVFSGVARDLNYALRLLRRSPGFSIAVIITIALTTGPTMAAIGLANWLFLRPMSGIVEPERVGIVWFGRWGGSGGDWTYAPSTIAYGQARDVVTRTPSIVGMAGFDAVDVTISTGSDVPDVFPGLLVSANYFDLLGAPIVAGRPLREEDDVIPGGSTVGVLSARLARALFGSTSRAIGQTMRLSGDSYEIVGVVGDSFDGIQVGSHPAVYLPGLALPRVRKFAPARWVFAPDRGPFAHYLIRLAPGATFARAQAEMTAAAGAAGTQSAAVFAGVGVNPGARERVWRLTRMLLIIGLTLTGLGIANLANLFVFRASSRASEFAIRRALGAGAARLVRVPVLETLAIGVAGGTLGLGLTAALRGAVRTISLPGFGAIDPPFDWRSGVFGLAISIAVALIVSVWPARLAARADLAQVIGRRIRGGTNRSRVRTTLAVVQLALSLALLVGAWLLVRTVTNLQAVPLGFDPRGVNDLTLVLQPQGYVGARALQFERDLAARLRGRAGVDAVSFALYEPFGGASFEGSVSLPDDEPRSTSSVMLNYVTSGYFATLHLPIVAGRTFTDEETFATGPDRGVVVSESLARQLFGSAPALGRLLRFPSTYALAAVHDVPVIGVVADAHWIEFDVTPPMLYLPLGAAGRPQSFLVRSSLAPTAALSIVRAAVRELDPAVPVRGGTIEALIAARMSDQRLLAWALGLLAAIGFILAAVGIHGLVSQTVLERLREFGIRRAVGATTAQVAALVFRHAARVILFGLPAGLLLAALGAELVRQQLFGVTPLAPSIYAPAALALAAIVALACAAPARRAARVDPVDVLRQE